MGNEQQVVPYNEQFEPVSGSFSAGWSQWNPWQNAPGGAIGQNVLGMLGVNVMNNYGLIPMGVGPRPNLYNNIRQQMFSDAHFAGMASASQLDMQSMLSTVRGAFSLAQHPLSKQEDQALQQFGAHFMGMGARLDPAILDAITGGRSAMALTSSIHLGGLAARDSVTGARGVSADSSAHIAKALYNNYFFDADYGYRTAGLTTGQMGGLYGELARRGMVDNAGTYRQRVTGGLLDFADRDPTAARSLMNSIGAGNMPLSAENLLSGLSGSQLNALSGNSDVQGGMRNIDSKRIINTLDKYKGAVAAIKELFGENGRPDAPMPVLLNALESLTQGGLTQLSSGRLEMTTRNLINAARGAGIDMLTLQGMNNAAGSLTNGLGISNQFDPQITTSGSLFAMTYSDLSLGSSPAWGLQNSKQMTASHMAAFARGAASPAAARLGMLLRLSEHVGKPTGDLANIVEGLKSGVIDPKIATMSTGKFVGMAAQGFGLSQSDILTALQHSDMNQEYVHKYNLAGLITNEVQGAEMQDKLLMPEFRSKASSFLRKSGIKDSKLMEMIAATGTAALTSLGIDTLKDSNARGFKVVETIRKRLQAEAERNPGGSAAALLKSYKDNPTGLDRALSMMVENAYGGAEQQYKEQGGENLVNLLIRTSPETRAGIKANKAETELLSALQSRSAGIFDGGSPLMELMRQMQSGGEKSENDLAGALLKGLGGGVDKKALAGKLAHDILSLDKESRNLAEMQQKAAKQYANNPEMRQQLFEQIDAKVKAITQMRDRLQGYMEEKGLTNVFGEMIDSKNAASEGGGAAGSGNVTYSNATINLYAKDGTISLKNATGSASAKNDTRRGAPVA